MTRNSPIHVPLPSFLAALLLLLPAWILGTGLIAWYVVDTWIGRHAGGAVLLFGVVLGLVGYIANVIVLVRRRAKMSSNTTLEEDARESSARPSP